MKVVHIVQFDKKFTNSYIDFFQTHFSNYQHNFLLIPYNFNYDGLCENDSCMKLLDSDGKKEVINADLVIISGIFGYRYICRFFKELKNKKIFLHFWGGDFYSLDYSRCENIKAFIMVFIKRILLKNLIKKAYMVLNLINGEYADFSRILRIEANHGVARFPYGSSLLVPDYEKFNKLQNSTNYNIIVGNSATIDNNHIEVFNILKKNLNLASCKIYCPLVYGDNKYKMKVLKEGEKLFGENFFPLLEYTPYDEYKAFLSGMDIGVYNIKRQQSLGNINEMIMLKKKIYLRKDSVLFNFYTSIGVKVFSIDDLISVTLKDLFEDDKDIRNSNYEMLLKYRNVDAAINEWQAVFNIV